MGRLWENGAPVGTDVYKVPSSLHEWDIGFVVVLPLFFSHFTSFCRRFMTFCGHLASLCNRHAFFCSFVCLCGHFVVFCLILWLLCHICSSSRRGFLQPTTFLKNWDVCCNVLRRLLSWNFGSKGKKKSVVFLFFV